MINLNRDPTRHPKISEAVKTYAPRIYERVYTPTTTTTTGYPTSSLATFLSFDGKNACEIVSLETVCKMAQGTNGGPKCYLLTEIDPSSTSPIPAGTKSNQGIATTPNLSWDCHDSAGTEWASFGGTHGVGCDGDAAFVQYITKNKIRVGQASAGCQALADEPEQNCVQATKYVNTGANRFSVYCWWFQKGTTNGYVMQSRYSLQLASGQPAIVVVLSQSQQHYGGSTDIFSVPKKIYSGKYSFDWYVAAPPSNAKLHPYGGSGCVALATTPPAKPNQFYLNPKPATWSSPTSTSEFYVYQNFDEKAAYAPALLCPG